MTPNQARSDGGAETLMHTPGPWRTVRGNPRRVVAKDGVLVCNALVATGGGAKPRRNAEAEANARLIAAAPDLYAALQRAHVAMWGVTPEGQWPPNMAELREAREQVRAALRLASGEPRSATPARLDGAGREEGL